MEDYIWRTKEGKCIKVCNLKDSHVINICGYFKLCGYSEILNRTIKELRDYIRSYLSDRENIIENQFSIF